MNTKLISILFSLLLISSFFSCKNDDVEMPLLAFKLSITQDGNQLMHSWTAVNISNFDQYILVRSTENIPVDLDPFSSFQSDSEVNKIVKQEFEKTTAEWEEIVVLEETKIYYRVFIKLSDRYIASNEVAVDLEEQLNFHSTENSDIEVFHHPDLKLIYFIDVDSLFAYDYQSKELVAETKLLENFYKGSFSYGKFNGKDEIYLVPQGPSDDEIMVLDAITLNYIESISTGFGSIEAINTDREGLIVLVKDVSTPIKILNRENGNIIGSADCSCSDFYFEKIAFASASENTLRLVFASGIAIGGFMNFTFSDTWEFLSATPISYFKSNPLPKIAYSGSKDFFIPNRNGTLYDAGGEIINSVYDTLDDRGASISFVFVDDESVFYSIDDQTLISSGDNTIRIQKYSFPEVELIGSRDLEVNLGIPQNYELFYDGLTLLLSYVVGYNTDSRAMIVPIDL